MVAGSKPEARLADAALRLLARKSWAETTLAEVARSAKLPLAELQPLVPTKPRLLGVILRRLGEKTAGRYKAGSVRGSSKDRLFDAAMTWFDVLGAHKAAVRNLYGGLRRDPVTLVAERGEFVDAAEWLMTLAEADKGPALSLRAAGFAVILGRALSVWLDDDEDMSRTMARLDGDLRRQERLFKQR